MPVFMHLALWCYLIYCPVKVVLCVHVRMFPVYMALSFLTRRHSKHALYQNGEIRTMCMSYCHKGKLLQLHVQSL
jgi:hypothetical protein